MSLFQALWRGNNNTQCYIREFSSRFFTFYSPEGQSASLNDGHVQRVLLNNRPSWLLWQVGICHVRCNEEKRFLQTGVSLHAFGNMLFSLKQYLPLAQVRDVDYDKVNWLLKHDDGVWRSARAEKAQLVEIFIPDLTLTMRLNGKCSVVVMLLRCRFPSLQEGHTIELRTDIHARTKLLSMVVEAIDTLLEDWYPMLGTRFVHTSEGRLLITRIVACAECLRAKQAAQKSGTFFSIHFVL